MSRSNPASVPDIPQDRLGIRPLLRARGAYPTRLILNYDFAGRRAAYGQSDTLAIGTVPTRNLAQYDYNEDLKSQILNRTVVFGDPSSNFSNQSRAYTYNADGSLATSRNYDLPGSGITSYDYDSNGNRKLNGSNSNISNNKLQSDGTYSYFYDADGNLAKKIQISTSQETDYTWDYRNRLVEVQQKNPSGTLTLDEVFTYDPLDRRIGASVTSWDSNGNSSTASTYTAYDGLSNHPYADFIGGSSTPTTRFIWADTGAVDLLLARLDGASGVAWYLTDEEGSVEEIVDPSGNVLDRLNYGPFGELISETNPSLGDRFKYASGAYDPNTGLIQFGLRYYDPYSGRWISQDPGGYAMGDSNLYRYVGNSPTSAVDPTGLRAVAQNWRTNTPPPQSTSVSTQGNPGSENSQWLSSATILAFNPLESTGNAIGSFFGNNYFGNTNEIRDGLQAAQAGIGSAVNYVTPAWADPVINVIDQGASGASSSLTAGASDRAREALYGEIATQNQSGGIYNASWNVQENKGDITQTCRNLGKMCCLSRQTPDCPVTASTGMF